MKPSRYFVIILGLLLLGLSFSVSRVTATPLLTILSVDTPVYTVDFLAPSSNMLPQAARIAIVEAMNSWTGSPPVNNTFSLIGLRWEDDWGLATLTSADLNTPLESGQHTHLSSDNLITLLLVETDSGWVAATSTDQNINALLAYVPETELDQSARNVIFPQSGQINAPTSIEQQYNNYKFPWPPGNAWRMSNANGWHGTGGEAGLRALDFDINSPYTNSDILAAAPGVVTHICEGTAEQYYLRIVTGGTNDERFGYLHLYGPTVRAEGITIGTHVAQGDKLGRMWPGSGSDNCGVSQGTHIHLHFPDKPFTIDGITFTESNVHWGGNLYSSQGSSCCGCMTASSTNDPLFQAVFPGMESNAFTPLPSPDEIDLPSEWAAKEEPEKAEYWAYWESDPTEINDIIVSENDGQTAVTSQDDSTPPTGSLDIRGGAVVKSLSVTLELTAVDEGSSVTDMRFSHDGQTWTAWEPFTVYKQWLLDESTKPQTVYAQVRDAAENASETMSATVTADLSVSLPASTSYQIGCSVFGMGGGAKSSASYIVRNVTGQPYATGILQGSNYQVHSGFTGACGGNIYVTPSYHLFVPLIIKR